MEQPASSAAAAAAAVTAASVPILGLSTRPELAGVWSDERDLRVADEACRAGVDALGIPGPSVYKSEFDAQRRLLCTVLHDRKSVDAKALSAAARAILEKIALSGVDVRLDDIVLDTAVDDVHRRQQRQQQEYARWKVVFVMRCWETPPMYFEDVRDHEPQSQVLKRQQELKQESASVRRAVQDLHEAWLGSLGFASDETRVVLPKGPGVIKVHLRTWCSFSYLFLVDVVPRLAGRTRFHLTGAKFTPGCATFYLARAPQEREFRVRALDRTTADPDQRTDDGRAPHKRARQERALTTPPSPSAPPVVVESEV